MFSGRPYPPCTAAAFALAVFTGSCTATDTADIKPTFTYESHRMPVQGVQRAFTAERPRVAAAMHANPVVGTGANPWRLQATLPGAVVQDIAFPSAQVGYAAAELGQVWKTSDGGENWTKIMDVGYPLYWYGVHALDENDVIVSGFDNQAATGVVRWSHDGGATWTGDIVLVNQGWSGRVRFADADVGLVMDITNFEEANSAHHTSSGGLA